MIAQPLPPSLGFDTSGVLTAAQYRALRGIGFAWCCRYVPLANQSPTAPGVLQPAELQAALTAGLGVMLVQFSRDRDWSAATGAADGKAAARYLLGLGIPPTVCLWADQGVAPSADVTLAYLNAWVDAALQAGMGTASLGVYFEPGCPLSAEARYQKVALSRYWATAAQDPNRFPTRRGCQLVQLWGSDRGEYQPIPGVMIDADVAQHDWLGDAPVAVFSS